MGLIDEIVHAVAPEKILFEAPQKDQQVWFVRRFGADVNLGNIPPEDVLSLETIRLGLRSDTASSVYEIERCVLAGSGILLARHGETDDNIEPIRVQGFRDTPLNDTGRRQAAELAERMAARGIALAVVLGSVAGRARRRRSSAPGSASSRGSIPACARPTAANGKGGCSSTSSARIPSGYAAWRRAGEQFRFPGGESLRDQLRPRQRRRWTTCAAAGELPALVVCHGGSIRVMLCARRPPRPRRLPQFRCRTWRSSSCEPVAGVRRSWRWSWRRAAAFFVTQHLKVTTPLLAGYPAPGARGDRPLRRRYVRRRSTTARCGCRSICSTAATRSTCTSSTPPGRSCARSPRASTCAADAHPERT